MRMPTVTVSRASMRRRKQFGMPMGPVELADRVGLDVALHVAEILSDVLATPPPELLKAKVAKGELGVKTGRGFYSYDARRQTRSRTALGSRPIPTSPTGCCCR